MDVNDVPAPEPPPPPPSDCMRCSRPMSEHSPGYAGGPPLCPVIRGKGGTTQALITFGAIALGAGGLLWLKFSQAASECSSALVSALDSQCGTDTTLHSLGIIAALAGAALLTAGLVRRGSK
jgi:hypothetical protein